MTGYSATAKWFHWITVGLMAIAIPTGFVISNIKDSDKFVFYQIHESAGLTLFLVAIARLAWRLRFPPPPNPAITPAMRRAAEGVHHALYAALILQPLLGFMASNAYGFPLQGQLAYLGFIDLPKFMEANVPLAEWLQQIHIWFGWLITALVLLHIAAVVFHQALRRDGTLLRMV